MSPEGLYLMDLILFIIAFSLGYLTGLYDGWRTCKRLMSDVFTKVKAIVKHHM